MNKISAYETWKKSAHTIYSRFYTGVQPDFSRAIQETTTSMTIFIDDISNCIAFAA